MKKNLFCMLLILGMLLLMAVPALAADSGTCGEGVTWTLDKDGTLTISGTGEIEDSPDYLRLNTFRIQSVDIRDGVTAIGERAFADCVALEKVTMADSVLRIGSYAFQNCERITEMNLSGALTEIESAAFFGCRKIPSLELPATLESVGFGAFTGCSKLLDIYYGGTETKWLALDIEEENGRLYWATVHFSEETVPAPRGYNPDVAVRGAGVAWTDAVPFNDENGRMLSPLRAVAEALGLEVIWDAEKREAVFTDGSSTLYFPIGSREARTGDGSVIEMDTAAVILEGRTYAPVRYLAEFFGYTVRWNAESRTALID